MNKVELREAILEYFKKLKTEGSFKNKDISKLLGISESTISKITAPNFIPNQVSLENLQKISSNIKALYRGFQKNPQKIRSQLRGVEEISISSAKEQPDNNKVWNNNNRLIGFTLALTLVFFLYKCVRFQNNEVESRMEEIKEVIVGTVWKAGYLTKRNSQDDCLKGFDIYQARKINLPECDEVICPYKCQYSDFQYAFNADGTYVLSLTQSLQLPKIDTVSCTCELNDSSELFNESHEYHGNWDIFSNSNEIKIRLGSYVPYGGGFNIAKFLSVNETELILIGDEYMSEQVREDINGESVYIRLVKSKL